MSEDGMCTGDTERCPVCDEPLEGATTVTSEGETHKECATFDDHADVLPDGGTELRDSGVAAVGGLVCQNFPAHDKEVKMVSGPYEGVICPECGRAAGGGSPLEIPYVDECNLQPGTERNTSEESDVK